MLIVLLLDSDALPPLMQPPDMDRYPGLIWHQVNEIHALEKRHDGRGGAFYLTNCSISHGNRERADAAGPVVNEATHASCQ